MTLSLRTRAATLFTAVLFASTAGWAGDAPGGDEASKKQARQAAMEANTAASTALLEKSAGFLAAQPKFAFVAQTGFDVVQRNGQQLAFFETKTALVRRPDRLRIETDEADGDERTFTFDGKRISIDLPGENAYVAVAKAGMIDEVIDYVVDDLEIPVPLHDFFSSNFYEATKAGIVSGFYVDEVSIGKRLCHHLAFRLADVDIQIWIEDGERPLPCALVITYTKAAGQPQYWAEFSDWDRSPGAKDKEFEFSRAEGAEKLSIQTAVREINNDTEAK
jgi:hypothetical protein